MSKKREHEPRVRWPGDELDAPMDWIEFNVPHPEDEHVRVVRVNVSFLLSGWTCIYGRGCPSVMVSGLDPEVGCCQIGVHIGDDELKRVRGYVDQLTEEDADHIDQIRKKWYHRDNQMEEEGYTRKTLTVKGACIFQNRTGGPADKVGCALHHLANRLDLHYAETKPDICWQIPLSWSEDWDEDRAIMLCTLTGTPGHTWGSVYSDQNEYPGYWCTESPDAYTARQPVYKSNEYVIRKIMGDDAYEIMRDLLEEIESNGGRRYQMPGEVANGGRKMIPLLVKNRLGVWEEERDKKALAVTRERIGYSGKQGKEIQE